MFKMYILHRFWFKSEIRSMYLFIIPLLYFEQVTSNFQSAFQKILTSLDHPSWRTMRHNDVILTGMMGYFESKSLYLGYQ